MLLTPSELEPGRTLPAGHRAARRGPPGRDAREGVPRRARPPRARSSSCRARCCPTWDLIASSERPDLDFLEYAYDLIYRRYPIDPARQALLGYSDGASYALSVGLSNPTLFRAVMAWAAGFIALEPTFDPDAARKPDVLLEYGTHDPLFPFEHVALPMRANLERAGYTVAVSRRRGREALAFARLPARSARLVLRTARMINSRRSFRLMLVYQLSQHTPLFWPYMFYFTTAVRGLPASDFGFLKSIYYFSVMAIEIPFGVVADRLAGAGRSCSAGSRARSAACST